MFFVAKCWNHFLWGARDFEMLLIPWLLRDSNALPAMHYLLSTSEINVKQMLQYQNASIILSFHLLVDWLTM